MSHANVATRKRPGQLQKSSKYEHHVYHGRPAEQLLYPQLGAVGGVTAPIRYISFADSCMTLSVRPSVWLSVGLACPMVCLSVNLLCLLFFRPSVCLSVHVTEYPSVRLSDVRLSVWLSVRLSVYSSPSHLSVCPSVNLSLRLCVRPSVRLALRLSFSLSDALFVRSSVCTSFCRLAHLLCRLK